MATDSQQTSIRNEALGVACILAALISGTGAGLWVLAEPGLGDPSRFATVPTVQRWAYASLSLVKSIGFFAGLFGFARVATRFGAAIKTFLALAALGAAWFAGVWLYCAATGQITRVYVLGGLWYQWIAPIAVGIAAFGAGRVSRFQSAWTVAVGLINAVIFGPLGPAVAQIVQGVVWLPIGWFVLNPSLRRAPPSS
ncbi:MAG TPA: hypothetical protein VGS57_19590 [Thermoanaerobaculia bacterium]|jgi:hypothetical protein|nr:hypothetical protein [Thermoanaerobaculia bacterium]